MPSKPAAHSPTRWILAGTMLLLAGCAAPHRLDGPTARPLPALPLPPAPPATRAPLPLIRPSPSAQASAPIAAAPVNASAATTVNPTLQLARDQLQASYQYTGLSDAQLAQQKSAETMIARGEAQPAYEALKTLNNQLKNGTKPYAVKSGDSLWIISGKPEIYGNPWLWPLIWQANLQVIPNPNRLDKGQELKIRPNPSIDEVVKAVDYAHTQAKSSQTRIGEVKEAR